MLMKTRRTIGSITELQPPLLSDCLFAASALHEFDEDLYTEWQEWAGDMKSRKPRRFINQLTVAGRALSKHAVRSSEFCEYSRSEAGSAN